MITSCKELKEYLKADSANYLNDNCNRLKHWLCHDDTHLYSRNELLKEAYIFTGDSILNKNAKMANMLSMLGKRLPHVGPFQLTHQGANEKLQ